MSTSSQSKPVKSTLSTSFFSSSYKEVIWLQHRRLGHIPFSTLKLMFLTLFKGLDIQPFHCDICEYAKHTRVSFPISNERSSPFFLIHSDIWGPSTIPNFSGSRWFVTFIDDCTRVFWIYLLKNKFDVSHIFPVFCTMVQNQFATKIKKICLDNARDYSIKFCLSGFKKKESYMNHLVSPLPNKMGWRKGKTVIFLSVLKPCCFNNMHQNPTRERLYSHQHMS